MGNIKKIIIVQHRYSSTTPKTQRMLAAAKEYVRFGVNVVFVISTNDNSLDIIDGVRFISIDENSRKMLRCYKQFVAAIKKEYDEESAILFYEIPLYAILFSKNKYRVFSEVTEIPFYGNRLSISQRIILNIRYFAARNFNGLFVISKALKHYYTAKGVTRIEVINMFVDKSRFDGLCKTNVEKYIAYCGTISLYKDGVDDLIRSYAIFNKHYPEYKLYIIGPFENETVKEDLERQVNDLKLSSQVVFTGPIESKEMPQKLLDASILALARPDNKQAQYGFPTKLGEYLATGNPVVVTKVGEIPMYIEDKINGILAEPNNPKDFAEKLIYAAEHPKDAAAIGQKGKELTNSEFSSKVQTRKALNYITK